MKLGFDNVLVERFHDVFVGAGVKRARDMRARLGLPKNEDGRPPMAVGVDLRGESYGLLIDQIGEVLKLADDGREENPVNLDPRMAKLAGGVHRLDGQLMVVLDVDRVLEISPDMLAA